MASRSAVSEQPLLRVRPDLTVQSAGLPQLPQVATGFGPTGLSVGASLLAVSSSAPVMVVIRGNAGSGKSTVAADLQHYLGPGTANVGQDHFRRVVLREHDVPDGDNIDLIASTVRHCLSIGYHVILEGILFSGHYAPMIRELLSAHAGARYVFYIDVPLEETISRHEGRLLGTDVPSEKLRRWYVPRDVLGVEGEIVINAGDLSAREVLSYMTSAIRPVAGPTTRGSAQSI